MSDLIEVRAFYGPNDDERRFPPGQQAFHAWAADAFTAATERGAASHRKEIGRVEMRDGPADEWRVSFERSPEVAPEDVPKVFAEYWNEALVAHGMGQMLDSQDAFCRAGAWAAKAVRVVHPSSAAAHGSLALNLIKQRKPAEEALQHLRALPVRAEPTA